MMRTKKLRELKPEFVGQKVRVYRNLHQDCWSIRHKGLVIGHALNVELGDVSFVVSNVGYNRYQREKVKNVHAFVQGTLASWDSEQITAPGITIAYSPKQPTPLFRITSPHSSHLLYNALRYITPDEVFKRAICNENKVIWVSIPNNQSVKAE